MDLDWRLPDFFFQASRKVMLKAFTRWFFLSSAKRNLSRIPHGPRRAPVLWRYIPKVADGAERTRAGHIPTGQLTG